jgi:hypothetical protein
MELRAPSRGRGPGLDCWEKAAALCWAAALAVVCARAAADPRHHNTYPIYTAAARAWVRGEGLYGRFFDGLDVFRYSPLVAALLAPLAALPDRLANVLWRLLNAGALLGALLGWGRAVLPVPLTPPRRGLLCLLVLPLAVASLSNGQCNCLIAGLVLAAVAAAGRERWAVAAGCLALASLWKLYPLAAGLLLVVAYPRLAGRLALALAVLAALPFLLQTPAYAAGQYAGWVAYLRVDDRGHLPLDFWLRDVRLLFRVWLRPLPGWAFPVLQVAAGLACAALCLAARRSRWPPRRLLLLVTGLACGWMTAVGPSVESCTFVLLAAPLAAALLPDGRREPRPARALVLWSAYGLLLLAHAALWFPWGKAVTNLGPQPLAVLLYLGCLAAGAWGELRRRPAEPPGLRAA